MKKLLIFGIGCVSVKYLAAALTGCGLAPVVLCSPRAFARAVRELACGVEFHEVQGCDSAQGFAALVAYLDAHPALRASIVAITSLFDEKFALVGRIARRYGWVCPGPAIVRLSDKAAVHALVGEFAPRSLALTRRECAALSSPASTSSATLARLGARLATLGEPGGRLILKPAVASGGLGIALLDNDAHAPQRIGRLIARGAVATDSVDVTVDVAGANGAAGAVDMEGTNGGSSRAGMAGAVDADGKVGAAGAEGSVSTDSANGANDAGDTTATAWIVQQALDGHLISCEGYVQRRAIRHLGLSVRSRIGLTEVANAFPADRDWPRARADAHACIDALVARSGLDNSYFHCEFIATHERAYLIDANIGRPGGASILEQIALAHGCAPQDVLRHALLLPLCAHGGALADASTDALTPRYRAPDACDETLGIWYGIPLTATVERVEASVSAPRVRHTQFAVEGTRVQRVGASDYAWVGMMSGPRAAVNAQIGKVRIVTDAGECLPAFVVESGVPTRAARA